MPAGVSVRPQKWDNVIDLYDDGDYSAIWGNYDGSNNRCLGVRWNGTDNECGYPSQGGNPLWYVEPDFVTRQILFSILYKVIQNNSLNRREEYQQNILIALAEFQ